MAAYTMPTSGGLHKVLSGTTADIIDVEDRNVRLEVLNRSANTIYARADSTTAVAGADGTSVIPPGQFLELTVREGKTLSVVGNGDAYSIDRA